MAGRIDNLFLCIGAQKAGTEWLWRMFFGHRQLFLTPVKEIHYFDHVAGITCHLDDNRRRARLAKFRRKLWNPAWWPYRGWYRDYMKSPVNDDWYAGLFRDRLGRRFAGEVTPEYSLIGEAGFRHVQRLAPEVRILFIMRDPVERAWSQAMHHARRMKVDLAKEPERGLAVIEQSPNSWALGDYPATIEALRRVFDVEQIELSFYEEVHANRGAAIERWCQFIGIDYRLEWFPPLMARYNRGRPAPLPNDVHVKLRQRFAPTIERVRNLVGRVPQSWGRENQT